MDIRKLCLYVLDFVGIATSLYLILTETFTYLGRWKPGQQMSFQEEFLPYLDQVLFKGFFIMMASFMLFIFLIGWRQKQVCFGTILAGAIVIMFLPLPRLGNIILFSGIIGVVVTYIFEQIKLNKKSPL